MSDAQILQQNASFSVAKALATAAAWITFHAQRAVYQRMCRRHNASKGKKG
jgi:hypothetical protein